MATPFASQGRDREKLRQIEGSPREQPKIGALKPAPPKERVGFECDFVERPPDIFQSDCPVCLLIIREPNQVTCCGYSFCRACIERVVTSKKPCPTCNEAEFSVFPDKRLQRSLYQFRVRCEHQKEGCEWNGELGQLDKHLNENPGLGNQLDGCEFTRVACIHCVQLFERRLVTDHQIGSCPRCPFSCDYCGDYSSDCEDVVTNHWPDCGYRPVPCPNECGVYPERRNVHDHLNKDCPLTLVSCDFHYAGCQVRLPRRDILSHLNEKLSSHMALLGVHSQRMAEMVMEKDEVIGRLTNELSEKLGVNEQKINELEKENQALRTSLEQKGEEIDKRGEEIAELLGKGEESKRAQESFREEVAGVRGQQEEESRRLTNELSKIQEVTTRKIDELEKENRALRTSLEQKGEEIAELDDKSKKAQDSLKQEIALVSRKQEDASRRAQETMKRDQETVAQMRGRQEEEIRRVQEALKRETAKTKEESKRVQEATKSIFKQELAELKAGKYETRRVQEALKRDHAALKREIAQLRATTRNEGELFKQELTRQHEKLKHELSKKQEETLKQQVTEIVKEESRKAQEAAPRGVFSKGATPSSDNKALKQEVAELSSKQETLLSYVPTFPIDITMTDFEKHKRDDGSWFSDLFYSHPHGYKMRLRVIANGIGSAKGTHVSVSVCLMRGEFDNHLRWPLQAHVTIRLLNQLKDRVHHEHTVMFSETSDPDVVGRVTSKERALGRGIFRFLPNDQLGYNPAKNCQYLKDDCLRFQVTRVSNLDCTTQLERRCSAIESRVCTDAIVPPIDFTMTDFNRQKQNDEVWYSLPFYTHTRGYRMCLRVIANESLSSGVKATHISVDVHLMRGEFDDNLKWPFRGNIIIQLLNQLEDKGHYTRTLPFTDETSAFNRRVTTGERGLGYPTLIAHSDLNHNSAKNRQYLKDDHLCFRVTKVELKTE